MKNNKRFLNLFNDNKPIIGMIHLKGNSENDIYNRAKEEIEMMMDNNIDGIIVENYFGEVSDIERVLEYLYTLKSNIIYGLNILGNYKYAFELANKYKAKFIQIDSVAGHLPIILDKQYEQTINNLRKNSEALVIGGVRFKYQPILSGQTLEQDLINGMNRCDGIVVTGSGTGIETDNDKINNFRQIMGNDFPLIVGAGLTVDNCEQQLSIADAAIVGSYFKQNHIDSGDLSCNNIEKFMVKVKDLRNK